MITAILKITGTKPRFEKILTKFLVYDFSIQENLDSTILEVSVPTPKGLVELKRRLGAKKDRRDTKVQILKMRGMK